VAYSKSSKERDMDVRTNDHDTDEDEEEDIFEKTPRKAKSRTPKKATPIVTEERQSGLGKSTSSRDDARRTAHAPPTRTDITVARDDDGNSKVQMDYETWLRVREFVVLADKYVDEHFKFRFARAKTAKTYRDRRNKDKTVGQAAGRDRAGHKGPGVN
jgi:hypothetical protein